jgi:hypothetical protein
MIGKLEGRFYRPRLLLMVGHSENPSNVPRHEPWFSSVSKMYSQVTFRRHVKVDKGFKERSCETTISLLIPPCLMEARSAKKPLCSLSEWSIRHVRDIFEARSEKKCLRAISSTFADGVNASINGIPLSREGINQLVLGMRRSSSGGLKVHWQQAMEVPRNPATNRVRLISRCDSSCHHSQPLGWILWRCIYYPRNSEMPTWNTKVSCLRAA